MIRIIFVFFLMFIGLSSCQNHLADPSPIVKSADASVKKVLRKEVHVVGVYESGNPMEREERFGGSRIGTVDIEVNDHQCPIILVLISYEPVIWRIHDPHSVISEVLVTGYYHQTIEGVKVPVTSNCLMDTNDIHTPSCVYRKEAKADDSEYEKNETKKSYQELKTWVKNQTGKEIFDFQGSYSASRFDVPFTRH